jgi:phosphopantetheine adenylyltransferase
MKKIVSNKLKNMWDKKVHVKSSMERKDNQWSLFIGRWQPLHEGHKELFRQVISEGGKVCVAIRDGEVNEKNPFSSFQVMSNIFDEMKNEVEEGTLKVIIIPDICSVEFGRGVGYDIIEHIPPPEVAEISATKIREQMKSEGKL